MCVFEQLFVCVFVCVRVWNTFILNGDVQNLSLLYLLKLIKEDKVI